MRAATNVEKASPIGFPDPSGVPLASDKRWHGRGALSKRSGRFEKETREEADDGWGSLESLEALKTNFHVEKPRTIFMGFSPGLDFETEIFVKEGAAQLLERELSAPGYAPKTIAIGTNTDPYQPVEKSHRIMRSILETLARANHPVGVVTKSALVLRDLDLLAPMAAKGLAKVAISVTTLDRRLARLMEPRAATPDLRLETIEKLSKAGVPTAVMTAPIIPSINDDEIEKILTRAHAAGAREAGYVLLRLPLELRDLFTEWLVANFPDRARRALALMRSTRDGKLYESAFGSRMKGEGPYAWMIGRRFEVAAARLGFAHKTKLRTDLFEPPRPAPRQLSLF
ncbi:MAG: PA0069 family radical SAM protein [Alphaproteobacteria bacterium]|nr:PA0069 family radical SAM protein [Alphaproteobacteria bacterium]